MITNYGLTTRLFAFLFAGMLLTSLTSCDSVSDATEDLRTQDVDMDLGKAGQVPLKNGNNAKTDQVDGNKNLPTDAFKVKSVNLKKENINYEPPAGKAPSGGEADVYLIVDQVPIVGATLTVENDEITEIAPNPISIGGGLSNFNSCLSSIDGGDDLYSDDDFDNDARESTIRSALKKESFSLTVAACVDDGLGGGRLSANRASVEIEIGG